jgi:hypothetical protein
MLTGSRDFQACGFAEIGITQHSAETAHRVDGIAVEGKNDVALLQTRLYGRAVGVEADDDEALLGRAAVRARRNLDCLQSDSDRLGGCDRG